ncbi:unnamed protein product [Diabrotica balteata]|uniref:acid phosphatase n=1 Tax=Diabrotica balteata TaxID=107213 RepID=A0A9N9T512_DIABA|nr:unnamed protein product [Diabrotica balteata]
MKLKLVFLVLTILVINLSDAKPKVKRDIEINPEDIKLSESFPPNDKKWSWYLNRRGKDSQRSEESEELYKDLTVDIEPRSVKSDEEITKYHSKNQKPESEEDNSTNTPKHSNGKELEKNQQEEWRWYVKAKPNDIYKTDASLEIVSWYLKQRGRTISPKRLRSSDHTAQYDIVSSTTNLNGKTSESSTGLTKSNITNNSTETNNPSTIGFKSQTTSNILEIKENTTVTITTNSSVDHKTQRITNKTEILRLTTTGIQEHTKVATSESTNINTQASNKKTATKITSMKQETAKEDQTTLKVTTTTKPATKESTLTTVATEATTISPSIKKSTPIMVIGTEITKVKPSTTAVPTETTTPTAVKTESKTTEAATTTTTEAATTTIAPAETEATTKAVTEEATITTTAETTEATTATPAATTEAATIQSTTKVEKRQVIDLYKRSFDELSKNNSLVDSAKRNRQDVGTKVTTLSSNIDEDIKDLGLPSAVDETSSDIRKKVRSYVDDTDTLLLVNVLFRHGNRTVERTQYERYPNDPYKDLDYFPTGIGQLTKNGRKRAFQIGRRLRKRYRQFLGDVFYPEMVEAQSTNMNRTKMTLELVLAGLFPPNKDDEISRDLRGWQPIPFNYLPLSQDPALMGYFCPKFKTEYKKVLQSPNNKLVFRRNKKIFKYISDNTGVNVTDFEAVNRVYLGFQAKEDLGLKLPDWTKSIYPEPMDELSAKYYYQLTGNTELKKMFAGNFLQQVLENIKRKMAANDGKFGKKIYLYSAHEFNVAALLASLGVYNNHTPNYGSYVLIELHVKGGVPGIKLFWDNWDGKGPRLLKLSGCQTLCPLTKFVELISKILPEEGKTECK